MPPAREFRARNPGADCRGELARPAAKAAVRHLLFSPGGELWVEAEGEDGVRWDVFDPAGQRIGTFAAPERARWKPPYVRGDRLYLVRTDSLDVPFVDVYRIGRKTGR